MASKKVFFHIGLPKTASTTIQFFCARNRHQLSQQGIDYLVDSAVSYNQINITPFAISLMENPPDVTLDLMKRCASLVPLANMKSRCLDLIHSSPFPTVVLSSEDFIHVSYIEWAKILKDLDGYEVRFIAYIRDMPSYLASNWSQHIKDYIDLGCSLEAFVENGRGIEGINDPYGCLLRLADNVGDEHLVIRPLDSDQWHGGQVSIDFVHHIGGTVNRSFAPEKSKNISFNRPAIELLRFTNVLPIEPLQKKMLRVLIQRKFLKKNPSVIATMTDQQIDKIVERYQSSFLQIKQRFTQAKYHQYPKIYGQQREVYAENPQQQAEYWNFCISELYKLI